MLEAQHDITLTVATAILNMLDYIHTYIERHVYSNEPHESSFKLYGNLRASFHASSRAVRRRGSTRKSSRCSQSRVVIECRQSHLCSPVPTGSPGPRLKKIRVSSRRHKPLASINCLFCTYFRVNCRPL